MRLVRLRWLISVLWLTFLLTASGCGTGAGKEVVVGKVSGKVTLDGDPVQTGCVLTFFPQSVGAEIGSALIGDGGTYVATSGQYPGMPIGQYRVAVSPPKMDPKEQDELAKKNLQIAMSAMSTKKNTKENMKELEKLEYPQDAIIPRKYWVEATSGLTVTVAEGDNTAVFELTKKK